MRRTLAFLAVLPLLGATVAAAADAPPALGAASTAAAKAVIDDAAEAMARARQAYLAALEKEQERAVARLQKEQDQLTRAGRLEAALAVKDDIRRIQAGELVAAVERPKAALSRPKDAAEFRGHHYALIRTPMRWAEARRACAQAGGALACIGDPDENHFLGELAQGVPAWIGASDEASEGRWTWVDGSPFSYAAWLRGRPDGSPTRNWCQLTNGAWIDAEDRAQAFVCEWCD